MPENDNWQDRFVEHLESLRENRGALASLRRGLGSSPGTVPAMYPYIIPWTPRNRKVEEACYVVGSLFALYPEAGGTDDLGMAFAKVSDPSDSLEKRFVALLNCHYDDLPNHLRQATSLLKSKDIPINWRELLQDIMGWEHESRYIQRKWARGFWQNKAEGSSQSNQTNGGRS